MVFIVTEAWVSSIRSNQMKGHVRVEETEKGREER